MATISTSLRTDSPQLQPSAQRLTTWRAARLRGQRIPEEFWQAAADLARIHGLNRTAATLPLNDDDLQRRLRRGRRPGRRRRPPGPVVEVARPAWAPGVGGPGTLEVVQASGARLTLRLPNASPKDLVPLVRWFLRHRS